MLLVDQSWPILANTVFTLKKFVLYFLVLFQSLYQQLLRSKQAQYAFQGWLLCLGVI